MGGGHDPLNIFIDVTIVDSIFIDLPIVNVDRAHAHLKFVINDFTDK